MKLFKNKKAQYARAMRREFASQDRAKRLYMTNYLLKKGHSIPEIAISLGVSSDTIRKYVSEINADKQHFDQLFKEQEASIKAKEKEDLRRKNRSLKEILVEELPKSFAWGLLWTIILYLVDSWHNFLYYDSGYGHNKFSLGKSFLECVHRYFSYSLCLFCVKK